MRKTQFLLAGLLVLFASSFAKAQCTSTPSANISGAVLQKVQSYKTSCQPVLDSFNRDRVSGSSGPENLAISDYTTSPPTMFIFSPEGSCLYSTQVAFGSGPSPTKAEPSCESDTEGKGHGTPPGFHVISTTLPSGKFAPGESLAMVGLEGQESAGRGIRVHAKPAGACTWGCSGVPDFDKVKSLLGGGSLVYNYFGDGGKTAKDCKGIDSGAACHPDVPNSASPFPGRIEHSQPGPNSTNGQPITR